MISKGFLQSEVLGEVSVLEGGSSGRSFRRSFSRIFRACFVGIFRAKKLQLKNSAQQSHDSALANAPTRHFHGKYRKKYPPARNSGLPEFTPKNTPKKYPKTILKIYPKWFFLLFFGGILGVFSWGSRTGLYFSWKFRARPSWGSVAGRGVPNSAHQNWRNFRGKLHDEVLQEDPCQAADCREPPLLLQESLEPLRAQSVPGVSPRVSKRCPRHSRISGLQKGPAERGHVKKRQKVSKSFSTLFDHFRAGQKTSKIVKKIFDTFRQFSRRAPFFRPLLGGSDRSTLGTLSGHSLIARAETLRGDSSSDTLVFGDSCVSLLLSLKIEARLITTPLSRQLGQLLCLLLCLWGFCCVFVSSASNTHFAT